MLIILDNFKQTYSQIFVHLMCIKEISCDLFCNFFPQQVERVSQNIDVVKENISHKVDSVIEHVEEVKENISHKVDTMKEEISQRASYVKENLSQGVDSVRDSVKERIENISGQIFNSGQKRD